jgi:hypothetical protein
MCIAAQPSKEEVREWLRRRRSAQSLPELEQIRTELGWAWCPCPFHGKTAARGPLAVTTCRCARIVRRRQASVAALVWPGMPRPDADSPGVSRMEGGVLF